jgi:hypothetical protein
MASGAAQSSRGGARDEQSLTAEWQWSGGAVNRDEINEPENNQPAKRAILFLKTGKTPW